MYTAANTMCLTYHVAGKLHFKHHSKSCVSKNSLTTVNIQIDKTLHVFQTFLLFDDKKQVGVGQWGQLFDYSSSPTNTGSILDSIHIWGQWSSYNRTSLDLKQEIQIQIQTDTGSRLRLKFLE
jgi:hypothetical protein